MPEKQVQINTHPLVQHKLSLMRWKETSSSKFRTLLREVSHLMAYEVMRDLPLELREIETPLAMMRSPMIKGKKLCLVSILRASNGLIEGMLDLVPSARVGHIGLYRDPETLEAIEYYYKMPHALGERQVIVVDPMLATANTAVSAIKRLKAGGATDIRFVCLLAAPEGIEAFHDAHPDVPVYTASVDEQLNDHGYILPGLGDAGDRIYGTR